MEFLISLFEPFTWYCILACFGLLLLITLYQFIWYWQPAYKRNRKTITPADALPPVSIVVCATNEYKQLRRLLPQLLTQDYPCYEVVVVNDRSEDNSEIMLSTLQAQYPHLQIRTTHTDDRFGRSPALALGVGIRAAQYELVLCTEAHCQITSPLWLRSMASRYGNKTQIVLGHTTHKSYPRWMRCDDLQQALHYLGHAATGRPYMGMGSNVLFNKQLFYNNNGFNLRLTRDHLPMYVFISEVGTAQNCHICTEPSGLSHSGLKTNLVLWKRQRKMERDSRRLHPRGISPSWEALLRLLFYISAIGGLCYVTPQLLPMLVFGSLIFLRLLSVACLYLGLRRRLHEKGLFFPFLAWDPLSPFVILSRRFY
jgi:Glycosyltransferases, probably involved in cell wall biogenesis